MRILVDHDGYDLLNLGGVAMLQGCVARLRQEWPEAEIKVIAHSSARLEQYCPGTTPIGRTFADSPYVQVFPRRVRLASEQLWRIAGPPLGDRFGTEDGSSGSPRTALQAVRWADVVVAAGGGYITDTWWWHAAGVLALLGYAQRCGKPTAMFGQGIGPLDGRVVRAMARGVFPRLAALGLREGVTSPELALSCGARRDVITITGDDAIEVIPGTAPPVADALGFNIRAADYSGVGRDAAARIGECVVAAAHELAVGIIGLPVSRYPKTSDLAAISACLGDSQAGIDVTLPDLSSPADLMSASASCRAVVTGSYHAAVYSLAQGVPAVCLTKSRYYDAKFAGLRALFPETCRVISLTSLDAADLLRQAIEEAWQLPADAREAARAAAAGQRASGRAAYRDFRLSVDTPGELVSSLPLRQPR